MTTRLRPGTLRAYALGVLTGTLMTATLTMCAAPAKADVTDQAIDYYAGPVCETVADHPSTDGLIGIGIALMDDGWTGYESGQIIASAIIDHCPRYIPILRAFVARYANDSQAIA